VPAPAMPDTASLARAAEVETTGGEVQPRP